jgi:hypothetical protein
VARLERPLSVATILLGASLGLLTAGAVGCSGAEGSAPTSAHAAGFPPWQATDKDLFDDEIDPAALGFVPPKNPRKDQTLWARSQAAEVVGRVRVQTITVDSRGGDATYHLGLQFAEPPLASKNVAERTFEVTIEPRDPAYGLVKALDTGFQGKTFVGFVKRFAGADDEVEVHFYLGPDSAELASVVQEAVAVQEVSK